MKYPGSKNNAARELHAIEPRPTINYCEPFGGTFAKFFVNPKPKGLVIYNDIDKRSTNLFKHLILNPEKLIASAQFFINSRAIWAEFESDLKKLDENKNIELTLEDAIKWLYVNINSFTGTGSSFKPTMNIEAPVLVSKLIAASSKLQENVIIENMDFEKLIKRYNDKYKDLHFYLDPPYVVAEGQNLYRHNFTSEDHIRLRLCCDEVTRKGNTFLLSYDYDPEIKDLYNETYYEIETMEYTYTMSGDSPNRKEKELLITNYPRSKQLAMFEGV
jgi:DNA adenine methylase